MNDDTESDGHEQEGEVTEEEVEEEEEDEEDQDEEEEEQQVPGMVAFSQLSVHIPDNDAKDFAAFCPQATKNGKKQKKPEQAQQSRSRLSPTHHHTLTLGGKRVHITIKADPEAEKKQDEEFRQNVRSAVQHASDEVRTEVHFILVNMQAEKRVWSDKRLEAEGEVGKFLEHWTQTSRRTKQQHQNKSTVVASCNSARHKHTLHLSSHASYVNFMRAIATDLSSSNVALSVYDDVILNNTEQERTGCALHVKLKYHTKMGLPSDEQLDQHISMAYNLVREMFPLMPADMIQVVALRSSSVLRASRTKPSTSLPLLCQTMHLIWPKIVLYEAEKFLCFWETLASRLAFEFPFLQDVVDVHLEKNRLRMRQLGSYQLKKCPHCQITKNASLNHTRDGREQQEAEREFETSDSDFEQTSDEAIEEEKQQEASSSSSLTSRKKKAKLPVTSHSQPIPSPLADHTPALLIRNLSQPLFERSSSFSRISNNGSCNNTLSRSGSGSLNGGSREGGSLSFDTCYHCANGRIVVPFGIFAIYAISCLSGEVPTSTGFANSQSSSSSSQSQSLSQSSSQRVVFSQSQRASKSESIAGTEIGLDKHRFKSMSLFDQLMLCSIARPHFAKKTTNKQSSLSMSQDDEQLAQDDEQLTQDEEDDAMTEAALAGFMLPADAPGPDDRSCTKGAILHSDLLAAQSKRPRGKTKDDASVVEVNRGALYASEVKAMKDLEKKNGCEVVDKLLRPDVYSDCSRLIRHLFPTEYGFVVAQYITIQYAGKDKKKSTIYVNVTGKNQTHCILYGGSHDDERCRVYFIITPLHNQVSVSCRHKDCKVVINNYYKEKKFSAQQRNKQQYGSTKNSTYTAERPTSILDPEQKEALSRMSKIISVEDSRFRVAIWNMIGLQYSGKVCSKDVRKLPTKSALQKAQQKNTELYKMPTFLDTRLGMHLPVSMVHSDLEEKLAYLQENNKLNLKREACGWLDKPGAVSFVAKSTEPLKTKTQPYIPRAVRKEKYDEMLAKFNREQQQQQQQAPALESGTLLSPAHVVQASALESALESGTLLSPVEVVQTILGGRFRQTSSRQASQTQDVIFHNAH